MDKTFATEGSRSNEPNPRTRSKTGAAGKSSPEQDTKDNGQSPTTESPAEVVIVEKRRQSLFEAPEKSTLVHACNAEGIWGAGIAKQFRNDYSTAHEEYQQYCQDVGQLGNVVYTKASSKSGVKEHSVASLIVKAYRGKCKTKAEKEQVLKSTKTALEQLIILLRDDGEQDVELHMPKINAGIFAIPWERTCELLEGLDLAALQIMSLTIFVYIPEP